MPTLKDVAALAGVSYQTVSRVLNAPERVSDTTRTRVLHAVAELAYEPDEAARALQARRGEGARRSPRTDRPASPP